MSVGTRLRVAMDGSLIEIQPVLVSDVSDKDMLNRLCRAYTAMTHNADEFVEALETQKTA